MEIAGREQQQQFVCSFPLGVHFCVEKSYDGTHLAFGGTLDWRCHFKHVSLKKKSVLPLSNDHDSQVKDQDRRKCCHNRHKNFPIGLHVLYLYFPDTPHIYILLIIENRTGLTHLTSLCVKFH